MRFSLCLLCLWPGLARAWVLARWEGLVLAAAFAAAMNTAVVASLARDPSVGAGSLTAVIAWVLAFGFWMLGFVWVQRDWPRLASVPRRVTGEGDDQFREAQHAYLKGHWIEAEAIVTKVLRKQPADIEARLLWASIQRRSRRWNEARRSLIELKESPAAANWLLEIESELRQIEEAEREEIAVRSSEFGVKAA